MLAPLLVGGFMLGFVVCAIAQRYFDADLPTFL